MLSPSGLINMRAAHKIKCASFSSQRQFLVSEAHEAVLLLFGLQTEGDEQYKNATE